MYEKHSILLHHILTFYSLSDCVPTLEMQTCSQGESDEEEMYVHTYIPAMKYTCKQCLLLRLSVSSATDVLPTTHSRYL